MWELRCRNFNEELHTLSIRQLLSGQIHVQSTVQTLDKERFSLPPPISQSTQALVTTISPKSSSNLDTNQGVAIVEMLRKVVQVFNQTPLTATAGNSTSNLDSNHVPHDNMLDRQPASIYNTKNHSKTNNSSTKGLLQTRPSCPHPAWPNNNFWKKNKNKLLWT